MSAGAMAVDDGCTKRKIGQEEDTQQVSKRPAVDAVPQPMEVENFSPELLRIYYDRLFPFQQMYRWLSYGNNAQTQGKGPMRDYFLRREFCFVLDGDIFCRYQCFKDDAEWKKAVMEKQPVRMELGALYTHPPKNHGAVVKDAYRPLERELVFDIDMDDYDDIRHCCSGSKVCVRCWSFLMCALKVLDRALREDFGFKHFVFVYSGRRGMHCWIGDKAARQLKNEHRGAVAEYLNLVAGGGKCRTEIKMNGCDEMHPSIKRAYDVCLPYFHQNVVNQDFFRQGPHLDQVRDALSVEERQKLNHYIEQNPDSSSTDRWKQIAAFESERMRTQGFTQAARERRNLMKEIVLQHSYPRLDINVSKQMNHLLKAPFCVHPKTGRVCVPIDPATAHKFDPAKVPTVGQLVSELNQHGDAKQTSLREYIHFFETKFLQPMEGENAKDRQQEDPYAF
jgi:DNA primase small subunit